MAGKRGAGAGDIKATVGQMPFTGADSGTWTAGGIQEKTYDKLTVGKNKKVVYEASCTFSFSGTGPAPAKTPIAGTETVRLVAKTTVLMQGKQNVLVEGDSQTSTFGNTLTVVSSTTKLTTT